jgi:hypothetical protein
VGGGNREAMGRDENKCCILLKESRCEGRDTVYPTILSIDIIAIGMN